MIPGAARPLAWPLVAATLVGLVLRLAFATLDPAPVVEDAAEYQGLAERLVAGAGYVADDGRPTAFRPPGLPFLLAAVYALTGVRPMAGRLALALLGAATVALVGLVAARLGGRQTVLFAAWGAALYPPFLSSWYGPRALLAEVPLAALATASVALALGSWASDGRRRLGLAVAAGVALGAGILTKGTLLGWLPFVAACPLLAPGPRPARVRASLAVLVGAAALVLPWTIRNQRLFGAWVPVSSNGGISLWASYNPSSRGLGNAGEGYHEAFAEDRRLRAEGLDEVERSRHFRDRALAEVRARPRRAAWLAARKVLLFLDPSSKDWSRPDPPLGYNWGLAAMAPLALLGAVLALGRPASRRPAALLVALVAVWVLEHALLHADVRYRLAMEPILIALAAVGGTAAASRLGGPAALAAAAGWLLLHLAVAWRWPEVFAVVARALRALGLG